MFNNKSVLAIIPARGGSKGLPGKNIKTLLGKPLIQWTIDAGLKSTFIDDLIVSTDDKEISEIAISGGVKVPFIRPTELANDRAKSIDVVKHAISFCEDLYCKKYDYVILLEPTSPMREACDIDQALTQLIESDEDSIVGIAKTEDQNPVFLITLDENKKISGYKDTEMSVLRRQDIKDVYFFEGSVYISKVKTIFEKDTFYHSKTIGFVMPKFKSLEIDDMDDFIMVEALMKYKNYK